MSVDELTDHFVILETVNFGAMVVNCFVVVNEILDVGGKRHNWLLLVSVLFYEVGMLLRFLPAL